MAWITDELADGLTEEAQRRAAGLSACEGCGHSGLARVEGCGCGRVDCACRPVEWKGRQ